MLLYADEEIAFPAVEELRKDQGTCLLLVAGQAVWAILPFTFPVWPKDGIVVLAVGRQTPSPPSHSFGRSLQKRTNPSIISWSGPHTSQFVGGKLWGMPQDFRDVDPCELRLPSRQGGADPFKLQRQIARFGASSAGMPAPWVYEASDGVLVVYNGVTRPTRIAKLAPAATIRLEVVGKLRRAYAGEPKIGDQVP